MYVPAELALTVSMLVLIALEGLDVVILVLVSDVSTVPVPEEPLRHTKDLVATTLDGTEAVHKMLKLLYGVASKTAIAVGSV